MPPRDEILVDRQEYEGLKARDLRLQALEEAGVDNWEGYDVAMDILREYKGEKTI